MSLRWAVLLGAGLFLCTILPLGPLQKSIPTASAHALPVKTDPASDAILKTPPQRVAIWFSETLIPQTSRIIVVDTMNHEVDNKDSQVSQENEMQVTLPLLPSGTYVVVWQSQSAFDGHIAGGSFLFRIARPDGTVPPVPSVLPTGHVPGAAGSGIPGGTDLDAYTILQTVMIWLAFLFMTFWVGGLIWETWILPPGKQRDPDLVSASQAAGQRFRRLVPVALVLILLTDVGIVCGQGAELAGEWSGAFSLPLLHVVIFESHFGAFWCMREIVALMALGLCLMARWKQWSAENAPLAAIPCEAPSPLQPGASQLTVEALPNWWQEAGESLRRIGYVPHRLLMGWCERSWSGRCELLLGGLLLLAFALSGHAAAVPAAQLWYALSIDMLHLIGDTAWVGGLFYIGIILVPTLSTFDACQRARILAAGLPEFSAFALMTFLLLAATGSLNTTIHLTSFEQFWTTLYGRILAIKIGIYCIMAAISAYHAFFLRAQLVQVLNQRPTPQVEATCEQTIELVQGLTDAQADLEDALWDLSLRQQAERLADWLQIEALLGVFVLLCVALLSAFAGTLTTLPPSASSTNTTGQTSQIQHPFIQTQQAHGYIVTLQVSPDTFGTNTFRLTVHDTQRHPVQGAAVLLETTMLDMDMGTEQLQLPSISSSPGTFAGQSDLTMAGRWQATVLLLPPHQKKFVRYTFTFSAS